MVHSLIGHAAPSFTAPNSDGEPFTLIPGSEGPIVLFFYPKSGSYGCTKQVCQLQALTEKDTFKRAGVQVVGVSPDSVEKQKAFVEKQKITYPVLSDTSGEARKAYSIGKHLFGPSTRTTFIIDKTGIVRAVLDATMNFAAHAKFVHKELDKLDAPAATEEPKEEDVATTEAEPASEVQAEAEDEPTPVTDAVEPEAAPAV